MNTQRIVHISYIKTSRPALWQALTDPDLTERYWGRTRLESDWKVGAKLFYRRAGEVTDEHVILAIEPPRLLTHSFHPVFGEFKDEPPSRVTFLLDQSGEVVRLTVVHDEFPPHSKVYPACREGWPMILSSLKTLLETGVPLPAFAFDTPPRT